MGAPESGMKAGDQPTAETLLTAFRTIKDDDRARHAAVLDYWLSIRADKEFPPLHDLDPLEISDAASHSILFELLSGGQDAEIRHLGDGLEKEITVKRLIDAPSPSLASSIARKLPIVGISRDFLSFEDNFTNADGLTRCWITLLPLSSCGSWVDYVYAFVSLDKGSVKAAKPVAEPEPEVVEETAVEEPVTEEAVVVEESVAVEEPETETEAVKEEAPEAVEEATVEAEPEPEPVAEIEPEPEPEPDPVAEVEPEPVAEVEPEPVAIVDPEPVAEVEPEPEPEPLPEPEAVEETPPAKSAGFSKILDGLSQLTGFYGQGVKVDEPVVEVDLPEAEPLAAVEPVEPVAMEPAEEPLELEEVAAAPEPEPAPAPAPAPVAEAAPEPEPLELEEAAVAPALEGTLQSKLAEVQAKADEAREAQVRATAALHEGLSAAYDFALDAETAPEEYLRLVEAQGLKIQLRAPMAPVAKLAFDGICDAATIRQFEAVLAWALKVELPRGTLLERIQGAGGIPQLLDEFAKAA
ncbi:hypothetical protein [Sphingomonas sp.]|uniref:hypothetical protein n=1 Tax=Sphingomonas sp. TaxID=28214 RepID=UPI0025EF46A6|nr:hypothetical protein [Sphingomonas sp.]